MYFFMICYCWITCKITNMLVLGLEFPSVGCWGCEIRDPFCVSKPLTSMMRSLHQHKIISQSVPKPPSHGCFTLCCAQSYCCIDVCNDMTDIDFLIRSTLQLSLYTLADVRVITVQAIIQLWINEHKNNSIFWDKEG